MKRARFPARTREEVGYRNAICLAPGEFPVTLGDKAWQVRLTPQAATFLSGDAVHLEAQWGDATYAILVGPATLARLLLEAVPEADAAELPEALQLAALEMLRGELEAALGPRGGALRSLRLTALGAANGATPPHRYGFQLTSSASGETIAGEIATDVTGLGAATPLLRAAPRPEPAPAADWADAVPIAIRLEAGSTTVSQAELADAQVGDLILLDECFLSPEGEMPLLVAPGLAFRGRLEDRTITVTQPLGAIMAETPPSSTERIPVRLTFDLGERSLTVAELRDLKPGYTFDLGREPRRAVSIRAQGQVIGEGELVEIDGTLGVAITALAAPAK